MFKQFDKQDAPFLRWVGGKQRLVSQLVASLPSDCTRAAYHEPFVGAGALFAAVRPEHSFLSDANHHLVAMYQAVRDNPEKVFAALLALVRRHSEPHYYKVRQQYNRGRSRILQAARFIYLNRTSYNGVFRVNKLGAYNVPFGRLEVVKIPGLQTLHNWSAYLSQTYLASRSFESTIDYAKSGDFVYLDPPYPPLNGTSFFTHYTWDRFDLNKQRAVADLAAALDRRRCRVMVSNADTESIRRLYTGWRVKPTRVARVVTAKGVAYRARELILTNY